MEPDEITADEASKILEVTPHHVRWYYKNGHLPGRRVGGILLVFKREDVERLKDNKPKQGRPAKAKKRKKK